MRKRRTRRDRRLDDLLHLLADGPPDQVNRFTPHSLNPRRFAELWAIHGPDIEAEWRRTGHRASAWWCSLAEAARVQVPEIP